MKLIKRYMHDARFNMRVTILWKDGSVSAILMFILVGCFHCSSSSTTGKKKLNPFSKLRKFNLALGLLHSRTGANLTGSPRHIPYKPSYPMDCCKQMSVFRGNFHALLKGLEEILLSDHIRLTQVRE